MWGIILSNFTDRTEKHKATGFHIEPSWFLLSVDLCWLPVICNWRCMPVFSHLQLSALIWMRIRWICHWKVGPRNTVSINVLQNSISYINHTVLQLIDRQHVARTHLFHTTRLPPSVNLHWLSPHCNWRWQICAGESFYPVLPTGMKKHKTTGISRLAGEYAGCSKYAVQAKPEGLIRTFCDGTRKMKNNPNFTLDHHCIYMPK